MFEKFSLKTKLLMLCGTLLFFTFLVGGVSHWGMTKIDSNYHKIVTVSEPKIASINKMYISYQQVRIHLRTLGLPNLTADQEKLAIEKTLEAIGKYEAEMNVYKKLDLLESEDGYIKKLEEDWSEFKAIGVKVLELNKTGDVSSKDKMREIFLKDCPEAAAKYDRSMHELLKFHDDNANKWVSAALSDAATAKNLQMIIIVIGLFGGLGVGYFFANYFSKVLNNISENLANGSDKIADIIGVVAQASSTLSSSIIQQASALQQTTSAVEQTSASVENNAENTKRSLAVSESSKHSVSSGKSAVSDVINSINDIATSTTEIKTQIDVSNEEIEGIVKIINEIESKTKIINEIVFQTKLLSFNASVEAARAGEHGKGFAVVAEEIGNLARMSGQSAEEIGKLLIDSTERVKNTVQNSKRQIGNLVEKNNKTVENSTHAAKKCSMVLDEIFSNVNNVDQLISEISTSSSEQSLSINEIKKAMNEIDQASQQNTNSSQKTSEAASDLEAQVDDFRMLVTNLNKLVG